MNRLMSAYTLMMFFVFALGMGSLLTGCDSEGNADPEVIAAIVNNVLGPMTGHYEGTSDQADGTTSALVLDVTETGDTFTGRLLVTNSDCTPTDITTFSGTIGGNRRELLTTEVTFDRPEVCSLEGLFVHRPDANHIEGQLTPKVCNGCLDHGNSVFTLERVAEKPVVATPAELTLAQLVGGYMGKVSTGDTQLDQEVGFTVTQEGLSRSGTFTIKVTNPDKTTFLLNFDLTNTALVGNTITFDLTPVPPFAAAPNCTEHMTLVQTDALHLDGFKDDVDCNGIFNDATVHLERLVGAACAKKAI